MWTRVSDPDHLAAAAEGISASGHVGTFGVHGLPAGTLRDATTAELVETLAAELAPWMLEGAPATCDGWGSGRSWPRRRHSLPPVRRRAA